MFGDGNTRTKIGPSMPLFIVFEVALCVWGAGVLIDQDICLNDRSLCQIMSSTADLFETDNFKYQYQYPPPPCTYKGVYYDSPSKLPFIAQCLSSLSSKFLNC